MPRKKKLETISAEPKPMSPEHEQYYIYLRNTYGDKVAEGYKSKVTNPTYHDPNGAFRGEGNTNNPLTTRPKRQK